MAFNMDPKKCPMPTQDPNVRNKNFKEVALGYTAEMAVNEAKRCIGCKNKPCQSGCPVGIDIPEFIAHVAEGDFEAAYQVINRSSSLPAVCGRVCPQESQCEGKCTRGIKNEPVAIGRLERFVADWHRENVHTAPIVPEWNGHKVAIIGAGPAGLTAAGDLAKLGYKVTVYEALHVAGGVLMYGIPEFRLPKAIVQQEIDGLKKMGVDFECNMVIGKVLTIDELMDEYGYEAVFVGSGAGLPRFMGIPGESLKGVYSANEFLTRSNLMKAYLPTSKTPIRTGKKVAVVGGGNVAMDAARSALRLGAESVYIVYRRGMAELPARKEEVEHAEEEGIIFKTLCNPVAIHPDEDGFVHSMTCIEMELGEPDASGRRRPIEKQGSEFELEVDTVIMSLGTSPNPLIRSTTPGLETNKHGCIVTEGDEGKTSRDGVYAGGDAVTGAATVIKAMGAGKAAAKAMDESTRNKYQIPPSALHIDRAAPIYSADLVMNRVGPESLRTFRAYIFTGWTLPKTASVLMYASQFLYGAAGTGHFDLAGFIVAVADDGLPPHNADENAPVIHHRDKVLVHGGFHQLIHAGGHRDGLVVPLMRKL